ncbi:MAG: magnesium/cobalt transporter CorA [Armatimonadota bacterium]
MNIALALAISADKSVKEISYKEGVTRFKSGGEITWIHLFDSDATATSALLERDFGFHPVAIEDAVGRDERPELKEFDDHIFLVAPAVVGVEDGEEVFDEIGFFVHGTTLVTVSHVEIPCIQTMADRWKAKLSLGHAEVGYILFALLDSILDDYFPRLDAMEDEVDRISDEIYTGRTDKLRELLVVKKRMLHMRRQLGPFRDVMNSLLRRELDFVTDHLEPYFHDLFDNTLRLTELVDTNREALTGLLDIHLSTVSNNLNMVMKKMTVISTVLMTCALVAGIYGMNFKHMPELEWYFGYPFSILLMFLLSAGIVWLFKKKEWL